ncbi:MAG: single stranded DNA-binding protein [Microgenomates group bacterium Gr01-1014_5]|nr:MAG: single stranded DNA-binding protein [Microgenomates group bacterium Gr01-1014_5]
MASRSLNKVILIGNLTRDPELRYTPQGTAVCTFGLATNRSWKTEDGTQREQTEFHTIVTWTRLAEIVAEYLTKGKQAYVEGRLSTREWEGQDGQKRRTTEIIATEVIFLGSPGARPESIDVPEDLGINEQKPETETEPDTEKGTKEKPATKTKTEETPVVEGEDIPF